MSSPDRQVSEMVETAGTLRFVSGPNARHPLDLPEGYHTEPRGVAHDPLASVKREGHTPRTCVIGRRQVEEMARKDHPLVGRKTRTTRRVVHSLVAGVSGLVAVMIA